MVSLWVLGHSSLVPLCGHCAVQTLPVHGLSFMPFARQLPCCLLISSEDAMIAMGSTRLADWWTTGGMKYDPEKAAAAGNGGLVSASKDMQHANGHEETARLIGGARLALGARSTHPTQGQLTGVM